MKINTGSCSPGDLGVETLSQTPGDCGSGNTGGLTREDPQASINNQAIVTRLFTTD